MTYRYYNEDVWEDLVDSVTMEEAIDRLSSQTVSAVKEQPADIVNQDSIT